MKLNNSVYILTFLGMSIISCKAQTPMIATNPANIDKTPTKVTAMKEADLKRWSHLDFTKDTVPGMSVDKAYKEILKNKKGVKVIVGIVDSGVDIEHEDLKSVIWTNKKEIAGNGIDDDKNGYVDDVHGWNFLGKITKENLEYERIVKNKSLVDETTYAVAKSQYDKKIEQATQNKGRMEQIGRCDFRARK